MTSNELTETVDKLSFLGDVPTQYRVAIALDGAECLDAAIITIRTALAKRERMLRDELRQKGKPAGSGRGKPQNPGPCPFKLPADQVDFDQLKYPERVWVYRNRKDIYEKYAKPTKADIMAIKDPVRRQKAIANHIGLFRR